MSMDEWTLEGTREYVIHKVRSGMYEYGRPIEEILEAVLNEGLGIFELDDEIKQYVEREEKLSENYVFSKYRACAKCHVVKDVEKEMVCTDCAAGKDKWENLRAK